MEKSLLKYNETKEGYTFFYRERILFKNEKNNPFLCIMMEKEGVKKLLPFNEFEIINESENSIEFAFFTTACVVKLLLTCDEKKVYFSFNKIGKPEDRLYIRLFKKNTKSVGLGLNEKKDLNKIKIGVTDKIKEKKKDKNFLNIDNTLNFYIVNSYYFSNTNINDWELEIGSAVTVSSVQENIEFKLEFDKRFNFLPQNSYKILKTSIKEQENTGDSEYDAFIVDYDNDFKTLYKINKIRKRNKGIFTRLSPLINEDTAEGEKFNKDTLIKTSDGYLINIKDEENSRKFGNYIRKIFDQNPDGIYVDEKNINIPDNIQKKDIIFYENLHILINKIKEEYPDKYIIYNKLNSSDKIVKIIKENEEEERHSLFISYKNNIKIQKELYSINYSEIKKKENVYINSLLFSGYKAYFYECGEEDIEKLVKYGKTQIIVDKTLSSKNKRFRKKKLKN